MSSQVDKAHSDSRVIALCVAISMAVFVLDSFVPLGVAGGVPYLLVVLVSLGSSRIRFPYFVAIGVSILVIVGFYTSPPGGEMWKIVCNRCLALFAIWITAVLSVQRKTVQIEREKALSELKVLTGMLPICASCKSIRDDQGCWSRIESYIKDHSEAEFSHGICPDCARRIYPDLDLG